MQTFCMAQDNKLSPLNSLIFRELTFQESSAAIVVVFLHHNAPSTISFPATILKAACTTLKVRADVTEGKEFGESDRMRRPDAVSQI